ncbi:MAG: DUF222 domain-containing protein [Gemmatimonadetes bacterium]|nr:DUF222 domain-containing protein [Gemmatimonadota bacterium]
MWSICEARPDYGVGSSADPDDEMFLLGERIADLARRITVAEHEMLVLLADFDARRGWEDTGFGSCAEWLAWRTGKAKGTAREWVRAALALQRLPQTSAAMQAGELSFSKVRAMTRIATPDNEGALLAVAHAGSAEHLENVVRRWKSLSDTQELSADRLRHRNRRFSIYVDGDGSYVVKGRLEPDVGALLMRAIEAASDALFRRESGAGSAAATGDPKDAPSGSTPPAQDTTTDADPVDPATPAQRRADAVGLIAARALGAGFGDARSGSRAERYQVMLQVDLPTLVEGPTTAGAQSGRSELDGLRVPAGTSRRLACDASVVRTGLSLGGVDGSPTLDLGRSTRTISPSLRRALDLRDRVCRFPGCACRFTDGHHIKHWADGGETNLRNLILLCRRHHRAVHEGGVQVCMDREGKVAFFTPKGRAMFDAPRGGRPPGEVGLGRQPRDEETAGRPPGPLAPAPPSRRPTPGAPTWRRDVDIPWAVEAPFWDAFG